MAKAESPAQEMQVVISFALPKHEDRVKELAAHGEVATRVSGVVEHLRNEFKAANVDAKIFSQMVTVRAPRKRRTKAQIQESQGNGAAHTDQKAPPDLGIPTFLKRPMGESEEAPAEE